MGIEKFIISLTSIPSRLHSLYNTLNSLVNQDYDNYEVHVNLPFEMEGDVRVNHDKIKIFYVKDIGPLTKLFYTLERFKGQNQRIISVDDDVYYNTNMLTIYSQNDSTGEAIGFSGQNIKNGRLNAVTQVDKARYVDILEGYKSICYNASYFEDDFFTKYYKLPVFDDALISGYLKLKGVDRVVIPHPFEKSSHWFKHFPTDELYGNPPSGCEDLKQEYGDYTTNYINFFNSL